MADVAPLLAELEDNARRLSRLHVELGTLLAAEKNAKVLGFNASHERSNTARETEGSVQALHITEDIFKLRAEVLSLEARRDYLVVAIPTLLQSSALLVGAA